MTPFQKNLHMTRQEAWVVFVLVVLLAALMFAVGLWVGMGFGPTQALNHESQNRTVASEASAEKAKPSEAQETKVVGAGIKKAYQDAKEQALQESMKVYQEEKSPKSIMDSAAHKEAHKDWDRKPSSQTREQLELETLKGLKVKDEKRLKEGPPAQVKSLFERSPDSKDDFVPVAGAFTLQVASFATNEEAFSLVRRLRQGGYLEAYTQQIKLNDGETWFRVSVGSYPNPVHARNIGEQIRKRGMAKDFIVRKVAD